MIQYNEEQIKESIKYIDMLDKKFYEKTKQVNDLTFEIKLMSEEKEREIRKIHNNCIFSGNKNISLWYLWRKFNVINEKNPTDNDKKFSEEHGNTFTDSEQYYLDQILSSFVDDNIIKAFCPKLISFKMWNYGTGYMLDYDLFYNDKTFGIEIYIQDAGAEIDKWYLGKYGIFLRDGSSSSGLKSSYLISDCKEAFTKYISENFGDVKK